MFRSDMRELESRIVEVIGRHECGIRARDIAAAIGIDVYAVAQTVRGLVARGIVASRSTRDCNVYSLAPRKERSESRVQARWEVYSGEELRPRPWDRAGAWDFASIPSRAFG